LARTASDAAEFAAAWEAGNALRYDSVIAEAQAYLDDHARSPGAALN